MLETGSAQLDGPPANGQRSSEATAPDLVEPSKERPTEAEASQWQGIDHFRQELDQLQERIRKLEDGAKKLDEKIGDRQGTDQEAAVQRLEEEQATLLLEAQALRQHRIALIEAVPNEHYTEAVKVRMELGPTINGSSSEQ